jgi:hypothetical protein
MPVIQVQDEFQSGDNVTASSLNDLVNDASFVSGAVDNSTLQVASAGHLKVKDNGILSNHLKSDATNDAVRAVTTNHIRDEAVTNDKIADNAVDTDQIAADAVTYAKIQNVSETDRVLGRKSTGAGNVEEISPSDLRTMINVEEGATADQTGAEMKTAIGNATAHTSDTDSDGINDSGGVDGLMSATDKTKLDGLVTNATHTGDVTGSDALTIATNAVTSDKLANDAVTSAKLANDAVTSAKISSTDNTFKVATTEVVINEVGADVDFRVEGDNQNNLIVTEASSDKVGINGPVNSGTGADKIPFYVNGDATSGFSIGAGGTIRIDADGAAGVTLNTTNASSPNQLAQIYNDTAGTIHFVRPQKSSNDVTHVFYADGDTESITGVYGTISDRNLKENINYLTKEQKNGQVEDIKNLRFAKYNLKGDKRTQLGVVAQDVEQTSPGLVSKAIRDGVEVRSVKQSIIHQKAVVALQVALEKIEALEARIKVLESK